MIKLLLEVLLGLGQGDKKSLSKQMSIDRGMDKDVVHIYNGILLSHIKEWNKAICSNMDGLWDCHTEWSKSDKEREMSCDVSYAESKNMIQMYLFTKQKQTHRHRKQTYGYQRGGGKG